MLGASKSITERILTPYIGNGTVKSGAIKLVAGSAGYSFLGSNKVGKAVSGGLVVDGIEDIVTSFLGGMNLGGTTASADAW